MVYFFNDHRGKRIDVPGAVRAIGAKFRKDMGDWAQADGVPVIRFKAEERKANVVARTWMPPPRRGARRWR